MGQTNYQLVTTYCYAVNIVVLDGDLYDLPITVGGMDKSTTSTRQWILVVRVMLVYLTTIV